MTTTNATTRRVSGQQLDILWQFLTVHRNIAVAYNRSLQAKEYSKRKWQEVAAILNAQGDGAHKDWRGWSKYWVDYKAKLKKRVSALRLSQQRTGGGPSTELPLSENESKFLQILGEDYGQGLSGVRVEPFALAESIPVAAEVEVQVLNMQEVQEAFANPLSSLPDPPAPAEPAEVSRKRKQRVESMPAPEVEVQGQNREEASPSPLFPLLDPPAPAEPAEMLSPRRRRRRREVPLTSQSTRRALVESSERRAQATVDNGQRLEAIEHAILQMNETLVQILNAILISRVLNAAVPRASE